MESSGFNAGPAANRVSTGPGELTAVKIREMMAGAQKAIAERKVELGLTETNSANGLNIPPGAIPDTETFDKLRRAAQLQAQIAARLSTGILSKYASLDADQKKPKDTPNVIFDAEGKTIDATTGEEIQLTHYTPTLKANLRAQRAQQFKEVLQSAVQKKPSNDSVATPYFDPRLRYTSLNEAAEHGLPVSTVINKAWITNLVEHPIKMKHPRELCKRPEIPLLLTKKERKKVRRQNRQEAQKERQEKIRLGLMPPPEPKVRLGNLMRVLGSDAVQDPSKVEAYVRAQMESRKRAHEASNSARKLTKEQARYRRIKKIKEDTTRGVYVTVYRVSDFSNPAHRFKVETNANQLLMTGLVALHTDCNVVVVEGGQRQQRKFERLMLHRVKWHEGRRGTTIVKEETGTNASPQAVCKLVWKGTVSQRAFDKFQFRACPTELFAREQFRKRDVEHYWDSAYSGAILESADN